MDKLLKNLESISKTLASSNRKSGPQCKFFDDVNIVGGGNIIHSDFGKKIIEIVYNAEPSILYEFALKEGDTHITSTGALSVYSGIKTGRSPLDKRIVIDTEDTDIWFGKGSPNISMDSHTYDINRETTICFLNSQDRLFVFDGFAGWDEEHQIKVRVITTRAYHALFMHNMLIRPTKEQLESFGEPDYTILNAGVFPCNRFLSNMTSSTSIDFNLDKGEILLLGTQYAGEMKKGVFSVMHYLMPKKGILSLHSSCNSSIDKKNTALFFGLSGTGKTTLSADSNRLLIGDDEHCWTNNGVFNIEGGCYAKCINLSAKNEPEIFNAIRYGSLLENVIYDSVTRKVDYTDISITQNTRCSYPIHYIDNAIIPAKIDCHPNNIIFLSCDSSGVLPAVSRLDENQAMYYFISGYTSKIPGTEVGIKKPISTFSACFGEAFLVYHPKVYAELLKEKINKHNAKVWLINTGWVKGEYSSENGVRCPLKYTRQIVNMIHSGELNNCQSKNMPVFEFEYFPEIEGIPNDILDPLESWSDKKEYLESLLNLSDKFKSNFIKYEEPELEKFGPK